MNNIQAPAYKRLKKLIELPYTFITKNLKEVAQDLTSVQINNQRKMTTLDIKDMLTCQHKIYLISQNSG